MSLNNAITNYKLFVEKKKIEEQKLNEKRNAIRQAEQELETAQTSLCKSIFEILTISELKQIWNSCSPYERYEIIEYVPEIKYQVEKLDSHGGLRKSEIEEEIISANWNECEWLEPMSSYFEEYCRHSDKCVVYNYKHESDTRGECICEEEE